MPLTIVDTSVWVQLFNAPDSPDARRLARLIEDDDAALTGLVRCEILVGFRGERDFRHARGSLDGFLVVDDGQREVRDTAIEIYRGCRRRGRTIRSLVDCLIAAAAIVNDMPLLHRDRDFDAVAEGFPLRLA